MIAVLFTPLVFFLGGWEADRILDRWIVPHWVKAYPHDGQIGLAVMMYTYFGGIVAAGAFLILVIWMYRRGANRVGQN